ncbi:hypothetical protein MHY85_02985 [Cellulomonas sp. ACRRI]|uniref:hypothetical protein n=1 Tax=Cellulomonas sp. ACRRI TaxID=2918188 RepID=UPI001EF25895|nr:hypothetical protein [Cellulomonas sp. ACRRI]MCG7284937.1 hypothetical protein [Cellulomonas sp. ACRRI]
MLTTPLAAPYWPAARRRARTALRSIEPDGRGGRGGVRRALDLAQRGGLAARRGCLGGVGRPGHGDRRPGVALAAAVAHPRRRAEGGVGADPLDRLGLGERRAHGATGGALAARAGGPLAERRGGLVDPALPLLLGQAPLHDGAAAEAEHAGEQHGRHDAGEHAERGDARDDPPDDGRGQQHPGERTAAARGGAPPGGRRGVGGLQLRGATGGVGADPVLGPVRSVHLGPSPLRPREPVPRPRGEQPGPFLHRAAVLPDSSRHLRAPPATRALRAGHGEHPQGVGEPVVGPRLQQLLPVPQLVRHQVRDPQADHHEGGRSGEFVHSTTVGAAWAPAPDPSRRVERRAA